MITQQMEEYLEAIGKLEERGEPATTSALARECGVAPPTVTEMLHRLAEQGLIHHEPRQAVGLTDSGRNEARTVIRRHRLWERFLHDALGLQWHQVHDEACQLEHATSTVLEQRLAEVVGDVATCPHGNVIPESALAAGAQTPCALPLTELVGAGPVRVVSVHEEGVPLEHLETLGIRPGAMLQVTCAGEGDALQVEIAGARHELERALARRIAAAPIVEAEGEARSSQDAVPLAELAPGERASLSHFAAGRGLVGRCLSLGFTPGAALQMVHNAHHGPVIVLVRDTRVALGRKEAQRIFVLRQGDGHVGHA
ncbi:MAG: iron dependent repressor, metal binding and dimerization domain protein [Anaerolineae bacterium]